MEGAIPDDVELLGQVARIMVTASGYSRDPLLLGDLAHDRSMACGDHGFPAGLPTRRLGDRRELFGTGSGSFYFYDGTGLPGEIAHVLP